MSVMNGERLALVATCSRGLEEVLAEELTALGADQVQPGRGMVRGLGTLELLFRANLELRTAVRVLVPLASGSTPDRQALYDLAAGVAWEELVERGQTILVDTAGRAPTFRDSRFPALVVKDALVDRLRARRGWRPEVDRTSADVRVHVHLGATRTSIALDSSGEPLSHRGYRPRGGPAPLSESLAAGLLLLAGYTGQSPFCDPMCGTGTIAIEAALLATGTAPGLGRRFAMERWAWVGPRWGEPLRQQAQARRHPAPCPVLAADLDSRAVAATRHNARAAGVDRVVRTLHARLRDLPELAARTLVVTNPPYGVRLGKAGELGELYRELGETLKRRAAGSTAWVLAEGRGLLPALGLRPARRVVLYNGPLECRFVRYDVRDGYTPRGAPSEGRPSQEEV